MLLRSLKVALVVGTILVMINYGDRLITGELLASDYGRIALTYCVPFFVSLYGAVSALGSRPQSDSDSS